MATFSHKERRIFFNSKEGTAGTADTYAFFEGRSMQVTFPTVNYLKESNYAKLGSGEQGTLSQVQALYTPFSIKASRLSEVAFLMSYCLGKADTVYSPTSGVQNHELEALAVTSRTLPTFTMHVGKQAATACDVFNHCIINDFSLTLAAGGNGVCDFTANGFANLHYLSSGSLTRNATTNQSAFSGSATTAFAAEPLINYKACNAWYGTALESTPLVQSLVTMSATDLGTPTSISAVLNSLTFTFSNSLSADDLLRAGGNGILNNQERKDHAITLELSMRKDVDYDAMALANTQKAIEIQFSGPIIGATAYTYGMDIFFPIVQFGNIAQDTESPINETLPCEVFEDSDHTACAVYCQNAIASGLNETLT